MRAAMELPQPFSRTQLVLAAWRLSPTEFGLAGAERDYPDAHRVQESLYAMKGPLKDGELQRDGALFRVKGEPDRPALSATDRHPEAIPPEPQPMPTPLRLAVASVAFAKFGGAHGGKLAMTFADACAFWGLPPSWKRSAVGPAIERMDAAIIAALPSPEVRSLTYCHRWLADRYEKHIALAAS